MLSVALNRNKIMRRITIRLIVAVLTFVIGIGLTTFWFLNRHSQPKSMLEVESAAADDLIKQNIEFQSLSTADGIILNGGNFASQAYQSSDGVKVSDSQEGYPSSERAKEAFNERLKNAVMILERNRKNEDGLEMGERVVGIFAYGGSKEKVASIIWLKGSAFYSISSSSLRYALAFERTRSK
jgi:hypothetical protein